MYEFRKIPYAEPPTGSRRFQKPVPLTGPWTGTLDATKYGPSCLDPLSDRHVSEDCLHLNIFVPNKIDVTSPRSVMIWVHGGAFIAGSAPKYDGSKLALSGDIILVTINYRLGPLGFFSTGDDSVPGNNGLWDQQLAIQWVHDNIADYGGDPNSVTIFGESAGGGSVSFQSLYPGNKGLFQKVIAMSGVATSYGFRAEQNTIIAASDNYLQKVNCNTGNGQTMMTCLQTLNTTTLLNTFYEYTANNPRVDGEFIKGYAEHILQNTSSEEFEMFTSIDYMVGVLNGDGGVFIPFILPANVINLYNIDLDSGLSHDILCQYLAPIVASLYAPNKSSVVPELCQLYKNTTSLATQSNAVIDLLTDSGYTFPSIVSADFHSLKSNRKSTTYMYMMTRNNPMQASIFPAWTWDWMTGATHAMDEVYLFNTTLLRKQPDDYELASRMWSYFTNFAKTR